MNKIESLQNELYQFLEQISLTPSSDWDGAREDILQTCHGFLDQLSVTPILSDVAAATNKTKSLISIYIDTGDVFEYETSSSAREHAHAIVTTGYRSVDAAGVLTWFPPHRITKVKATKCDTVYPDTRRGT